MAKRSTARTNGAVDSMSLEALFELRDEIAEAVANRTADLRRQLEQLTGQKTRGRKPGSKGRKVAPQFRSRKNSSLVWSGRGVTPRWMKAEMKGTQLTKESFRIRQ